MVKDHRPLTACAAPCATCPVAVICGTFVALKRTSSRPRVRPRSPYSTDMPSVLITAFEPYDRWKTNSSWLTLVRFTQELPSQPTITTRLYPVDFAQVKERLAKDLAQNHDYAIHLGQAPGSSRVQLESIAINVGGSSHESP